MAFGSDVTNKHSYPMCGASATTVGKMYARKRSVELMVSMAFFYADFSVRFTLEVKFRILLCFSFSFLVFMDSY
jgi:hypothetical protein